MRRSGGRLLYLILLMVTGFVTRLARADAISFEVSNPLLSTTSGGTVTFDGTVTNDSGTDLNASDFFFNFFGYDFTSVTPIQDLGVVTDFLIPNGTTSPPVGLFDVGVGAVPAGSTFPIDVQLENVNGDLSATQTVTVSVPGRPAPIPEPATTVLLGTALIGMILIRGFPAQRKRKSEGEA